MPRELREEQVLQAATEEFGRAGYSAASLAEIGRQAGVSKAMVLSYFRSKDDLFAVCVQRVGSRLAEHVAPVLLVPAPTGVLAEATIVAMLTALADRPSDWNLLVDPSVPRQGVARDAAREARALIGGAPARWNVCGGWKAISRGSAFRSQVVNGGRRPLEFLSRCGLRLDSSDLPRCCRCDRVGGRS
jgi:AcrR family transcriptional regulator